MKLYPYSQKNQKKTQKDDRYMVKRLTTLKIDIILLGIQEILLCFNCELPIKGYYVGSDKNTKLRDIYMKMPLMMTSLKEKINPFFIKNSFSHEQVLDIPLVKANEGRISFLGWSFFWIEIKKVRFSRRNFCHDSLILCFA